MKSPLLSLSFCLAVCGGCTTNDVATNLFCGKVHTKVDENMNSCEGRVDSVIERTKENTKKPDPRSH